MASIVPATAMGYYRCMFFCECYTMRACAAIAFGNHNASNSNDKPDLQMYVLPPAGRTPSMKMITGIPQCSIAEHSIVRYSVV